MRRSSVSDTSTHAFGRFDQITWVAAPLSQTGVATGVTWWATEAIRLAPGDNHVTVTVRRDGVTVDSYDHD